MPVVAKDYAEDRVGETKSLTTDKNSVKQDYVIDSSYCKMAIVTGHCERTAISFTHFCNNVGDSIARQNFVEVRTKKYGIL